MSWESVPLRYVTRLLSRGTVPDYVDDGPIRMVSQAANQKSGLDWERTRFHSYLGDPRKLKGYLQSGDSLVNSTGTGTLGRVGWFGYSPDSRPCVADGHVTVVRFNPHRVHPRFGYYYLKSSSFQRFMFETLVTGSTNQIELSREGMRATSMPVPALEEQRRIADFLDAETLRIDALAETHRKLIAVIRERFATLVDSELRSASHAEVPLRRLLCRPPEYGSQAAGEEGETTWPRYIRITDLSQDGGLKTNDVKRLAPNLAKPFMLEDGDIVLARSGATVGKGFLYRAAMGAACFAGYLVRIRPVKDLLPEYLSLWLRTRHYWDQIKTVSTQATIQNVSADRYGSLLFPIAGRDLQGGIAERLSKEHKRITALEEAVKQQLDLLAERRQALITAAVTGQLDVTTARSGVR